jgi:hypothetical protein
MRWPRRLECACPYGPYLLVPLFFTCAAITCTGYAAFECTFLRITGWSQTRTTVQFGLWSVEKYRPFDPAPIAPAFDDLKLYRAPNKCTRWSRHEEIKKSNIDMPIRIGRAVTLLAFLCSFFVCFCLLRGRHKLFTTTTVQAMSCCMLLLGVIVALSFLSLQSDLCQKNQDNCKLGFAGYSAIAAVIFWVIACCTTCTLAGTYVSWVPSWSECLSTCY